MGHTVDGSQVSFSLPIPCHVKWPLLHTLDGIHLLGESYAMNFVFISCTSYPTLFLRMPIIATECPTRNDSSPCILILATWMLGIRWLECQLADIAVQFHSDIRTGKKIYAIWAKWRVPLSMHITQCKRFSLLMGNFQKLTDSVFVCVVPFLSKVRQSTDLLSRWMELVWSLADMLRLASFRHRNSSLIRSKSCENLL